MTLFNSIFYIVGGATMLLVAFFVLRERHDKPLRDKFNKYFDNN